MASNSLGLGLGLGTLLQCFHRLFDFVMKVPIANYTRSAHNEELAGLFRDKISSFLLYLKSTVFNLYLVFRI